MWLIFSLLAAVCFGTRGILYQWTSQKPMNRNLMLFGTFFTGSLVSLLFSLLFHSQWSTGVWMGVVMGVLSFCANGSMVKGFTVGKASLVAVLTALPPIVVVILAYFFWGEKLSLLQFLAFALIVGGVIMIRYSNDISLKHLQGAGWAMLATLFFGLNDLSGKQSTLLGADTFLTAFCMFTTGAICFAAWWLIDRRRPVIPTKASETSWTNKRTFLWGMVVGTTNVSGMFFILTAFKYGVTGLVSAVVAVNVLIILIYSRIFVKDKISRLELAGMITAILGILVIRIFQ
jgi:drug/metabolite transporter (DMT)-like permease